MYTEKRMVEGKMRRKIDEHHGLSFYLSDDKELAFYYDDDQSSFRLRNNSLESIDSLFEIMGYRRSAMEVLSVL